ncbi:Uncharacterised protein [Phocoenobacter uteri]|uniref:Uncharacterized protein n=1 Tax=Phocoenobacter uteri TaxID=146806 RepID=A0A379C8M9_9PAST|nr:hypothetical protein [Phocoenobacter uteri]MDG6882499.1 hypothetical protein [Phocoenobacter uteri]SUB58660.1 Uncharacterised protein [Phocoenobacter uteri]
MKKLLLSTLLATTISAGVSAEEVSGTTNFTVNIPEVLVLYHLNSATLTLTGEQAYNSNSSIQSSTDISNTDHTFADNESSLRISDPLANKELNVVIEDAWGVRSLSSNNVTLKVQNQSPNLIKDGTDDSSKVVIKSDSTKLKLDSQENATLSLPSKWATTVGDLLFTLDLSHITKSGEHKAAASPSAGTNTFKFTLTGN